MNSLIGKPAPHFDLEAVGHGGLFHNVRLDDYRGCWLVVFFYPLDFTFVCPSEIVAFDNRLAQFKERGCEVIGASVDSHYTHLAWRNTPLDKGGIGQIQFPLVADLTKQIGRDYDVLTADGAIEFRGTFLIDQKGIVRHQVVNDLPLGRNIDEAIRMVDALQFNEKNGEVCPAGWNKGKEGMKANSSGVASYLAKNAKAL
jgi:peroxiredoxin 2/4